MLLCDANTVELEEEGSDDPDLKDEELLKIDLHVSTTVCFLLLLNYISIVSFSTLFH